MFRVLVVTLQLGVLAVIGVPLLANTQPFLPALRGALLLAVLLALALVAVWPRDPTPAAHAATMELVRQMLRGLGEPVPIRLGSGSGTFRRLA